jgi:3-methyladenine DNA glycosylase AlkC
MAEALKDSFGPDVAVRIAAMIEAVHPAFPSSAFVADALMGYDQLELTPRAQQIARALGAYLPADFEKATRILLASLGPPIAGDELTGQGMALFLYLPHVFYVAEHGLGHWETAMYVQHELTQRFSCEYSIRAFLEREPARTLARLREWTTDPNPHVRRLVSEGTRPRLPWAPRLRSFQDDPGPVIELLELLKDDPTTLVRRSVANNLNDIGKDHPTVLVDVCRRWLVGASPERLSLISHALRSAIKRGDRAALDLLGFGSDQGATIDAVTIEPAVVAIGQRVRIGLSITNTGAATSLFNVDLKVHFIKANGGRSPKVFKVRAVELAAMESTKLAKSISLAQHTTRTHYPGEHAVEVFVNGVARPVGSFTIIDRPE